jgi:hypothetical protein
VVDYDPSTVSGFLERIEAFVRLAKSNAAILEVNSSDTCSSVYFVTRVANSMSIIEAEFKGPRSKKLRSVKQSKKSK